MHYSLVMLQKCQSSITGHAQPCHLGFPYFLRYSNTNICMIPLEHSIIGASSISGMWHMQYTLICWVSTSNWEHFHLSCLKAFDQMLSHQWLIIRNQLWLLTKAQWSSKCDCEYATITCTALALDSSKLVPILLAAGDVISIAYHMKF